LPTLSAGLVFHHYGHPFSDVVERVTGRLKAAKHDTGGACAAISFLDLTSDGDSPVTGRPVRTVEWLGSNEALLSRLAVVPASQRANLLALCRQAEEEEERTRTSPAPSEAGPGVPGAQPRVESAVDALARRVVDLGSPAVWEVVAGREATSKSVAQLLSSGESDRRQELRHQLDLARWWPPTDSAEGNGTDPAIAGGAR
jgi:hypothetical protein